MKVDTRPQEAVKCILKWRVKCETKSFIPFIKTRHKLHYLVMLKFKSKEELDAFVKQSGKVLVIRGQDVLDVTTFASHHPGNTF